MILSKHGIDKSIIIFLAVCLAMVFARSSIYPSIYWNPWNPLFACEDPTINVRIGDTINFLCPSDEYNFYIPFSHVNPVYENLYFLNDDEAKYKNCNAIGARRLLRCDDRETTSKLYTISFRDIQTSERSMKFDRGKDYYLIGTGFRKTNKLDNKVNGSCRDSGSPGQYKLRLKIHVCKNDEHCNICKSAGCYYEKCGGKCSNWKPLSSDTTECAVMENRTCVYPYLNESERIEYRPRSNFNRTKCEESRKVLVNKTRTENDKAPLLSEDDGDIPIYKILVVVLGFNCLALLLFICIRSNYFKGMSKKLRNTCFLIGGDRKNKNNDENHKLSIDGHCWDDEIARPRTEVVSDFFMDADAHRNGRIDNNSIYQELLNSKMNPDIDMSKKIDKISDLCKELLANASDEIEKSKTRLIIDLLLELQGKNIQNGELRLEVDSGDSGIDDPDGRVRVGSDNLAYRNSTHSLPKKKASLLSPPS